MTGKQGLRKGAQDMGGHSGGHMSIAVRQRIRMELAAEELLESVLHRQRWAVADRDAVAEWLTRRIETEMKTLQREEKT